MLDHFAIFTRGGIRVWTWSGGAPLRGQPLDALVRSCLVEDRPPEAGFAYAPPCGGAPYALKWALHNVRPAAFFLLSKKACVGVVRRPDYGGPGRGGVRPGRAGKRRARATDGRTTRA